MVIYLRHHIHGTKVATSEAEALSDEKNGWERFAIAAILTGNEDLPKQEITGAEIEQSEIDDLRQKWAAKYGSPPHHRKGLETLRAEIAA